MTDEDKKALKDELKSLGIGPSRELFDILKSSGFGPDELRRKEGEGFLYCTLKSKRKTIKKE